MSEFELSLFRQRARAAFEQKVKRGCVLWEVPVGFVRTDEDRVEKSPDRQIQSAIQSVFQKFHELGSARQTMLYFRDEQIRLPEVVRGTAGQDVVWRLPTGSRIRQILRNPHDAGAFAYGRTGTTTRVTDGQTHTARRCKKPLDEWTVWLPETIGNISGVSTLTDRPFSDAPPASRGHRNARQTTDLGGYAPAPRRNQLEPVNVDAASD